MKSTVKKHDQDLSKIDLTISIESEEELNLLKALFGCNISVPQYLLYNKAIKDEVEEQKLSYILDDLYISITL